MECRQVLGRQLPGQREQGVLEVVAMGTWMLTKAREAVSSHSALLRSPRLVSQAGSLFAFGSTGRRVAPSSRSTAAALQSWSPNPKPRLPAWCQHGHHHLHSIHRRVPALRGTGKVSCPAGSPRRHRVSLLGGCRALGVREGACACLSRALRAHRGRQAAWFGGACMCTTCPELAVSMSVGSDVSS